MTRTARLALIPLLAVLVAFGAVACSSDDDNAADTTTTTAANGDNGSDTTAPVRDESDYNLVEVIVSAGSYTILAELFQAANLVGLLVGDTPYTVFAPTDQAFAAAAAELEIPLPELKAALLKEENADLLKQILEYHVVEGKVLAADVVELAGTEVQTLSGDPLRVEVEGETVTLVDGAGRTVAVVDVNVEAVNGVIHVVENVLLPSVPDLS